MEEHWQVEATTSEWPTKKKQKKDEALKKKTPAASVHFVPYPSLLNATPLVHEVSQQDKAMRLADHEIFFFQGQIAAMKWVKPQAYLDFIGKELLEDDAVAQLLLNICSLTQAEAANKSWQEKT
ncbi:Hypothetical predicted protein [Olea europaea subsp. europaea]|uniref:Uncharacterized protein n=1 Tax=Olea europaea subsp. europaea TaxID=158383 RepID=A0A8S0PZ06_OLEEU|nr:Hypothetical predicted protein [Olea europaea subsp. europaea]